MIFHIAPAAAWEGARQVGTYRGDTLDTEGFIHCSTAVQVLPVANRLYRGRRDLVLLAIDPARAGDVRYEESEPGEQFPHLYGPLDVDAVTRFEPFLPAADGAFREFPVLDEQFESRREIT